jgi:cupin-like protein
MSMAENHPDWIEQANNLAYQTFVKEHLRPHRPVILQDALKDWKAIGKWTPEFFRERFGDRRLTVDSQSLTLGELVRYALDPESKTWNPYLRNYPVRDISSELIKDIQPAPEYVQPNWFETPFYSEKLKTILGRAIIPDIFIGGAASSFPFLHYDLLNSHAFLCQIYGTKLYTLYSPEQTPYLYRDKAVPNRSAIEDIEHPNLAAFPLFARARGIRGVLSPGQMLFIPAGWWHSAKLLTPAITVSISVANSSNWTGVIKDQYWHALRSPKLLHKAAAFPLATYLAAIGLYRYIAR